MGQHNVNGESNELIVTHEENLKTLPGHRHKIILGLYCSRMCIDVASWV